VRFGDVRITHPSHTEADDNSITPLYPSEARLRNLTYESLLMVDMRRTAFNATTGVQEGEEEVSQEWLGNVPIMIQSAYCRLRHLSDKDKTRFGECTFDQVRRRRLRLRLRLRLRHRPARSTLFPRVPRRARRAATSSSTAARRC